MEKEKNLYYSTNRMLRWSPKQCRKGCLDQAYLKPQPFPPNPPDLIFTQSIANIPLIGAAQPPIWRFLQYSKLGYSCYCMNFTVQSSIPSHSRSDNFRTLSSATFPISDHAHHNSEVHSNCDNKLLMSSFKLPHATARYCISLPSRKLVAGRWSG